DINVITDKKLCEETYGIPYDEWIENIIKDKVKKLNRDTEDKPYTVDDFKLEDLVFRWMTYEHIPLDENWPEDKPKKKPSDGYKKVNFPPFQHFVIENNTPKWVGYSHYNKNNEFDTEHGSITPKLGRMYMLLVEKISKKS